MTPVTAYRDPVTGEFKVPPEPETAADAELEALFEPLAAAPEPVERAVPAPAGGVRVRLGNRFRSAVVGVRTEDGEVAVACGGDEQAGRGELQPGVAGEEELP
jgi:hypothetical protein